MKTLVANPAAAVNAENIVPGWFYLLYVLILVAAFWTSEHDLNRSVYFRDIDNQSYDGTHNRTADKLGQVDRTASVTRISFAMLGLYLLVTQKQYRIRFDAPLLWLSLAVATMFYASVMWSVNPMHTLFKLVVLSCLIIAAIGFASRFSLRLLLEWFAFACAIYICIGVLAELYYGTLRAGGDYRFVGTSHPNTEAIYGSIVCLCARLFYQQDRSKLTAVLLFGLGFACILATKSRTTLAATVAALVVIQIVSLRGWDRLLVIVTGMFAIGSFAIAAMFLNSQGFDQLTNVIAMGRTDDVTSLTGRLPLWEELLLAIQKSPALGYGYLAFWDSDRVEILSSTLGWEIPHGHNMYLDVAIDIGIVGALLFVAWLISALLTSANQSARTGKVEYAIVAGIMTSAMINGGGESLFKLPGFPLFILVTATVAILRDVPASEVASLNSSQRNAVQFSTSTKPLTIGSPP